MLVHVHFQNDKQAEEFRREFEMYAKTRDGQKHGENLDQRFLSLLDVKGYDERI